MEDMIISRKMYEEVKGQNALLKETYARLQKAVAELEERNANQFEMITQLRIEKTEFEKIIGNKNEQIIRVKQNFNDTLEENNKLKAEIAQLIEERTVLRQKTFENSIVERIERKKEAAIYKELYQQLIKYHIG